MRQVEYRILKENSNTFIANFKDHNEALTFLKAKIKEDEDEFSHRNYSLTQFELVDIKGKETWVVNEKFGKRKLDGAKTSRGLLEDLALRNS